jgi:ATP-binding cassette, subfamily B, bacterial HlyB/CyaB
VSERRGTDGMAAVGNSRDTGLQCLAALARHHGVDLNADKLAHDYGTASAPVSVQLMLRMAKTAGFKARTACLKWSDLAALGQAYPVLALLKNGNWVVVIRPLQLESETPDAVCISDPLAEQQEPLPIARDSFCEQWDGTVLLAKRKFGLFDRDRPFGFLYFLPELAREARIFRQCAIAALMVQLLAIAVPVFFQILVDKVLVHEGYATLYVLSVGIVVTLLFDAVFSYLRRFLLLYATNRVDVRLGIRTFAHLLGLPISFFEQRTAGVIVKHVQQVERIREFLTGRLFLSLLDGMALFVFIPILLLYSAKLTLVVLAFACCIMLVIGLLVGPYRRRLSALYDAEGARQGLIVESVHGIHTLKSLAIEPVQRRVWEERLAQVVNLRFGVDRISTVAQAAVGLLEKLMTVAIVCIGTIDVFAGSLSVGALIAFNMLAGRVSGPLVQFANMVHEYQDVALSVRMLGEVMNHKPEQPLGSGGLRPEIKGRIEFEDIRFRYTADAPVALDGVSFSVPENSVLGIVGRSGSGKTTVTRLMQGLYGVQFGIIRVDGLDIRELDLAHLRRSIGVVLQDNFLFRGTVRDNIAITDRSATFAEVVKAAQLAGAEEFIERLPRGFNTLIEENGANLSGGQKQRIAIARALLTNPKILIFDEATSALDPDSEMIIRNNLRRMAKGRTVIIVSHRLSTLTGADSIFVIERGKLADSGRHDQLLSRCTIYRHLWNQQTRQSA